MHEIGNQGERRSLSVGIVTFESASEMLRRLFDSLVAALETTWETMDLEVTVDVLCNDESPAHMLATVGTYGDFAASAPRAMRCGIAAGHGNIGYGAAQNIAIRNSSAEFHLVLNPDVALDSRALVECIRFLDANPGAAMVAPRAFDGEGRYARLAKRAPSVLVLLLRGLSVGPSSGPLGRLVGRYVYSDRLPAEAPAAIDLASGCFMFCRTSALEALDGFDERYFLYFEDYDLSRRIARYGGIFEVPTVSIRHDGGHTASRGIRRIASFLRSALRYFNRHGWRWV